MTSNGERFDGGAARTLRRARLSAYAAAGLVLVVAGILATPAGWLVTSILGALLVDAVHRLIMGRHRQPWLSHVDILLPCVATIVIGLEPSSVHLLVAAQVIAALLAPRAPTTIVLVGAIGVTSAIVFAGIMPIAPLPPEGYLVAERGAVLLGVVLLAGQFRTVSNLVREMRGSIDTSAEEERQNTEMQQRLVSAVGHELRTPLAAILGFAEILATDTDLPDTQRTKFASTINAEAVELAGLVDDIVAHLKLTLGQLTLSSQWIDASELLRRVVLDRQSCGTEIDAEALPTLAPVIGDPDRLEQVVQELIDNAVRYGGDTIRIGVHVQDELTEIWVHDNGEGLPPGRTDDLFEAFVQADAGRGLGLGLSIAHRLTEAMGAALIYDDGAGGARFVIALPTAPNNVTSKMEPAATGTLPNA